MGKRIFDCAVAAFGLIALSPLLAAIAVLVWAIHGRPVLFRQLRPGRGGRPFLLVKFRTMRELRDSSGALLPDSERLTSFGRFLRRTSLDELPELINVLRGEMSLVGPRPLLLEYLPLYTPEQSRRHEVRPGVTGWAQVSGRNALPWQARFDMDVWYVDHRSAWLDLKILLLTVWQALSGAEITQPGAATMEPFRGRE